MANEMIEECIQRMEKDETEPVIKAVRSQIAQAEKLGVPLHPSIAWLRARRLVYGGERASAATLASSRFRSSRD